MLCRHRRRLAARVLQVRHHQLLHRHRRHHLPPVHLHQGPNLESITRSCLFDFWSIVDKGRVGPERNKVGAIEPLTGALGLGRKIYDEANLAVSQRNQPEERRIAWSKAPIQPSLEDGGPDTTSIMSKPPESSWSGKSIHNRSTSQC